MTAGWKLEALGGGVFIWVSPAHTFGTDSFLLADFAAPRRRDTVCDLCGGCGIVPLLFFREIDSPRLAYAVEIRREAVEQMRRSAGQSGLLGRFLPLWGDVRRLPPDLPPGGFDLVTCNPPYNPAGTGLLSRAESDRAARHETLCTLEDVCQAAARLLRFGGRICLCYPPERLCALLEALRRHRLEPKRLRFVQKNAQSAPWLLLVEARLGGKPGLRVEKPLLLWENGEGSSEMKRIYTLYGRI